MALDKHEDNYEGFFDKHDAFMDELKERCAQTKRYEVKPDEVTFFSGHIEGNDMILERIVDNQVERTSYPITPENEKVWKSQDVQSIGLFIRYPDENGIQMIVPLSQMSKLSLGNRSKLTFSGDWSLPINKIALARMYEDLMQKEIKKEAVQVITVSGPCPPCLRAP